jgi:hypothetical protein
MTRESIATRCFRISSGVGPNTEKPKDISSRTVETSASALGSMIDPL